MPGPGFTRSDICSIRAVASHVHCSRAARGALSAEGRPLAAGDWLASVGHDVARIFGAGGAWLGNGHRGRRTGAGR
jgi:hypothetical protein